MTTAKRRTAEEDWVQIRRDPDTGIESVHAHFRGHAYDPHDHDEVLVGVTHQGVQRFRCHRSVHTSTPGRAILIEPGAVHDGHAPDDVGFTYGMLYLPQAWVAGMMQRLGHWDVSAIQPAFRNTLTDDTQLSAAIQQAFLALHQGEGRLARDQSLDRLMGLMAAHLHPAPPSAHLDAVTRTWTETSAWTSWPRIQASIVFASVGNSICASGCRRTPILSGCGCAKRAPCWPSAKTRHKWP
jgi:hypothetical protein